jgi:hypothetical protein
MFHVKPQRRSLKQAAQTTPAKETISDAQWLKSQVIQPNREFDSQTETHVALQPKPTQNHFTRFFGTSN